MNRMLGFPRALAFSLLAAPATAMAQDVIAIPVVPAGVSPVLSWVMTVTGGMITIFIPIIAMWLRTYLGVQNARARASIMHSSIDHAAHLADFDRTQQNLSLAEVGPGTPTMDKAIAYVGITKTAYPEAFPDAPAVDQTHVASAITAELQKINKAKEDTPGTPKVVLSPVSVLK